MSEEDRVRWEAKHAQGREPSAPQATLAWLHTPRPGAMALDLACGTGRHCVPLAALGYRVVAVDIAASALHRLPGNPVPDTDAGQHVMRVQADLDHWPFGAAVFDLVLSIDFLDRRLFGALKASVRPGGYVLIDTFCGTEGPGPRCAAYRLERGELARVFADWHIVRNESPAPRRDAILARKLPALTR